MFKYIRNLKRNKTKVTWANLHLDQFLPLYGTMLTHSELIGAIWTQFGLVWYWSWSWSWKKEIKYKEKSLRKKKKNINFLLLFKNVVYAY